MFFDKTAIEKMVKTCVEKDVVICGSYRNELRDGIITETGFMRDYIMPGTEGGYIRFEEYQNDFFFQSFIYNHEFLERNKIHFKEYMRYEDPPFLLSSLACAERFYVIPIVLHCYRKGHQNRQNNEKYLYDSLSGIRDNLLYAEKHNYKKLFCTLIGRLIWMYKDEIMRNKSLEINEILGEIDRIFHRNADSKITFSSLMGKNVKMQDE